MYVWRYSGWGGRGGVTLKETTAMRCQLARHDMGCVGIECLRADDIELREMRRHRRQRSKQAGAMMRSSIDADQQLVLCLVRPSTDLPIGRERCRHAPPHRVLLARAVSSSPATTILLASIMNIAHMINSSGTCTHKSTRFACNGHRWHRGSFPREPP